MSNTKYYAVIRRDGRLLTAYGIGETPEKAVADSLDWTEADSREHLETVEVSTALYDAVDNGTPEHRYVTIDGVVDLDLENMHLDDLIAMRHLAML